MSETAVAPWEDGAKIERIVLCVTFAEKDMLTKIAATYGKSLTAYLLDLYREREGLVPWVKAASE